MGRSNYSYINKLLLTPLLTYPSDTIIIMAKNKIHPQELAPSNPPLTLSAKGETYTLWMKSLVFHSNGCTVYDSKGDIVYRVDNYDRKGTREVNLMDLRGRVLCTIHKRLIALGRRWEGYRSCNSSSSDIEEKPWFQVKRKKMMMMKKKRREKVACEIRVGCVEYCIVRNSEKEAAYRIVNKDGNVIAEAKQKQSSSGVVLGNDVLTLYVAPNTDHSLVMALVTAYGLICGTM
ncbi:hypothetical protein AHAS_Ahas13G0356100 [Arachis hypogaea]|uniref:Protein LURP-one-related n=2 Tax=Arachis TaxID=3817 RepID=A0A444ZZ12_ARAHY|nr:hypothetical protein Ahy_B03g064069 [Arachis hypogaea]